MKGREKSYGNACVCVYVAYLEKEQERKRESKKEREPERESERES